MAAWNLTVFELIHGWSGHFVFADVAAIFFAEYLPYLLVVGFLVLVFRQPGARRKFYLFAEGVACRHSCAGHRDGERHVFL